MVTIDDLMGLTYEALIEMLEEIGWEYEWAMDYLYVSDIEEHWVAIQFTDWVVTGWEPV